MMSLQGGLHRALQAVLFQTALYGLLFLCTVTVLGIYSYVSRTCTFIAGQGSDGSRL